MNPIEQLVMVTRTPHLGDPEAEWIAVTVTDGTLRLELDDGETIDMPAGEIFALFAPPRARSAA